MRHIATLSALVFSVACDAPDTDGSGFVLTETRELDSFTGVEASGVNARVSVGSMQRVQVTSDDNMLSAVRTEVIDGVLFVSLDDGAWSPSTLEVSISVPSLSVIGNHDGADMIVAGVSGDVLEVSASGIGHTELAGEVGHLIIDSSGSGTRNAQDLRAESVTVTASGSGVLWLTVEETIDGHVSEDATLNVFGDPGARDVSGEVVYY